MGKVVAGNRIGISKEHSLLGIYQNEKSGFSTQDGNAPLGGVAVVGGFSQDTYAEKYAGGDGDFGKGAGIGHNEFEVFTRVVEKPQPPIYRG